MPTTVTHQAIGITYTWTLNLDNVQSGLFWDGSPYIVSQPGLKVMNVQMSCIRGGVSVTEPPCMKQYHALRQKPDGTLFYGHLYLNGIVKNPKGESDYSPTGVKRFNKNLFDSRYFDVFNSGWRYLSKSTDSASSYDAFDLTGFLEYKQLIESGTGIGVASGDVVVVAKSNYDPDDPDTFTRPNANGYPYQELLNRSVILGYGTLFVLDAHPQGGGSNYFRPPVIWPEEDLENRPLFALSQINPRLPVSSEINNTITGNNYIEQRRPLSYQDSSFKEFCYGVPFGGATTYSQYLPLYPAYGIGGPASPSGSYGAYYIENFSRMLSSIYADKSNVSLSEENRLKIIRCVVQYGIDAFGGIKAFSGTSSGAGQRPCVSRPWSVIAGWFLNNNDMRAPETTMLYGSYANRTSGILTTRAISHLAEYEGTDIRTMNGYRAAAVGGTEGYALSRTEWNRQVLGEKNSETGRKRRVSRFISLEGNCYHKVSDDLQVSRINYYKNIGRSHYRSFGYGVQNSPPVTALTTTPQEQVKFVQSDPETFSGTMAYLRWSTNPFPSWAFDHDGKEPTIEYSYIKVTEDPGSNTSTTALYRVLRCSGSFKLNIPVNGYWRLYLDRNWEGGTPSQYAKYEMIPFTENEIGEIFYIDQGNFNNFNPAFINACPNLISMYGGICFKPIITTYSWILYAKRVLNNNQPVDLDEDAHYTYDVIDQQTKKMPYGFRDMNFKFIGGLFAWQMEVVSNWLGLSANPIAHGWEAIAYAKGEEGWDTASGVETWNGVSISSLGFDSGDPPEIDPVDPTDPSEPSEPTEPELPSDPEEPIFVITKNDLKNPSGSMVASTPKTNPNAWLSKIENYGVLRNQHANLNLASATNFRFMLDKIPTVTYFCVSANAPSFSSEPQEYAYMMGVNPKFPGGRSSTDISIRFIIDEGFINYREMYRWMRSGLPYRDFTEIVPEYKSTPSDGRLFLLNNKKNPIKCMTFGNLIPTQLSGFTLTHNETEPTVLTATVNFQYDTFNVFDVPKSDPSIY